MYFPRYINLGYILCSVGAGCSVVVDGLCRGGAGWSVVVDGLCRGGAGCSGLWRGLCRGGAGCNGCRCVFVPWWSWM